MTESREMLDFDALWRKLAPQVRAGVLRYRWTDAALGPDDLVQEVRIRVWEVLSRDTKSRLGTSYYIRVVNSAIVDCLRKHRGTLAHGIRDLGEPECDPLEQIEAGTPSPHEVMQSETDGRRLQAALDALPADRKRAVALFLQGFTVAEIAELLNCDIDRAQNRTYRGVRAVKQRMGSRHG